MRSIIGSLHVNDLTALRAKFSCQSGNLISIFNGLCQPNDWNSLADRKNCTVEGTSDHDPAPTNAFDDLRRAFKFLPTGGGLSIAMHEFCHIFLIAIVGVNRARDQERAIFFRRLEDRRTYGTDMRLIEVGISSEPQAQTDTVAKHRLLCPIRHFDGIIPGHEHLFSWHAERLKQRTRQAFFAR